MSTARLPPEPEPIATVGPMRATLKRTAPPNDVQAHLGNILDHWERVPNDIRSDPGMDNLNAAVRAARDQHVSRERMREKIAADPDLPCEAGTFASSATRRTGPEPFSPEAASELDAIEIESMIASLLSVVHYDMRQHAERDLRALVHMARASIEAKK